MGNLVAVTWGCHGSWTGRHSTTSELVFGEDQLLWPRVDCTSGTNELIGEDLSVIIILDASQ